MTPDAAGAVVARGGGRVRLTPEQRETLGRMIVALFRLVARLGWTWGTVTVLGVAVLGTAVWTVPTWWPALRDWLEQ